MQLCILFNAMSCLWGVVLQTSLSKGGCCFNLVVLIDYCGQLYSLVQQNSFAELLLCIKQRILFRGFLVQTARWATPNKRFKQKAEEKSFI